MGFEHTVKCAHIKANGKRCQCPAVRKGKYCVFHSRARQQTRRILRKNAQARFVAPVLEDAKSIQLALSQVVELLAAGKMDAKVAGPILYALQTASNNLRLPDFRPVDEEQEKSDAALNALIQLGRCVEEKGYADEETMAEFERAHKELEPQGIERFERGRVRDRELPAGEESEWDCGDRPQ